LAGQQGARQLWATRQNRSLVDFAWASLSCRPILLHDCSRPLDHTGRFRFVEAGVNKIAAAGLTQTLPISFSLSLSSLRFSHEQLLGADGGALAIAWLRLREEKVAPAWAHSQPRLHAAPSSGSPPATWRRRAQRRQRGRPGGAIASDVVLDSL